MKLVIITAILAVCGAAKLDRTYLPPPSAHNAGGSSDSLQTPLIRSQESQGDSSGRLPTGSYTNNLDGVVVDAAVAGTRASPGDDQSGLGGARETYGSTNSKVGDAAFKGSVAGFRNTPTFGSAGQNYAFENKSERPQAFKDRNSNIITYANDVSSDKYSYGFETDNGIAVGENGVANNGIQAQGGYSYQGDDGQVYKVTYVADEGGYRPQGAHLPTPPPIPKEILESLEQNAKDEAAGLVDDGSYDAQKYNAGGDYTHHNGDNIQYNGGQLSQFAKRPESDASASSSFINQNSQAFGKPSLGQLGNSETQYSNSNYYGQANQFNGNKFGPNYANNRNGINGQQSSQTQNAIQESFSNGQELGQFGQNSGSQLTQQYAQELQYGAQIEQQKPITQFGVKNNQQESSSQNGIQSSQLSSQVNQAGSASQFGAQPNKPLFGQTSNAVFNTQSNQVGQLGSQTFKPSFSSNSQTQNVQAFKKQSQSNNINPEQSQGSEAQLGIQGVNKPVFGTFGSNKPSNLGQSQSNNFISTTGNNGNNLFGAEYLPPFNSNDRPSQTNEFTKLQEANKNEIETPNVNSINRQNQGFPQSSSASAFASIGPAAFETQPAEAINFQNKPQNQFNYNSNNQLKPQQTSSQHSGSHGQSVPFGSKPTVVPETELTTPLETNEKPVSFQESQIDSQSTGFGNFGPQALNNQVQPQVGAQNNNATQPSNGQNSLPSFSDSRPQATSEFGLPSPVTNQGAFSASQGLTTNQGKPQYPQISITQNQQNIAYFTTQKPSFSQGPDDSYYYNQPARPFNTPVDQSQDSRFPNSPSYQSNGVVAPQNNQFNNQESFTSMLPVAPTYPSQFTQTQENQSTNYYNGITQAAISSFPSVSPTTSTQYDKTEANQFGSRPNSNKPISSQAQPNKPLFFQQSSGVPLFPSKVSNTLDQRPTASFDQTQFQFGQSSSNNNAQSSAVLPIPAVTGQKPSTSFLQNIPETSQEQQSTTTSTQQYQGTIYEYNKPKEILPAPEQTDSSSSQTVQADSSVKPQEGQKPNIQELKPQFGAQQAEISQGTFSSQSPQSNLIQGIKPNFGQNNNPLQETSHSTDFISHQGLKPFVVPQSMNSQYGQNIQTGIGNQQGTATQFGSQFNKPFESASTSTQFGQAIQTQDNFLSTQQNTQNSQASAQTIKPSRLTSLSQGANVQPPKLFGTTGSTQGFQGYPSSKPLFGTELNYNKFSQSSQQTTEVQGAQEDVTPFANSPSAYGSPNQQKPLFGQNIQLNQVNTPSGALFGQQSFQNTQFGSIASKPQFGASTQYAQNQEEPNKPFSGASSQAQFNQNTAQASNSAVAQQGSQTYKPFGSSPSQGSRFQNKPQLDQAPLGSSLGLGSQTQFGAQVAPLGQNQLELVRKPLGSSGTGCCQGSKDSAIAPLNVGKPSQAFAQTQSQFSGFQGGESFNAQSVAGKGEEFGGPRQPPSFDAQTGYHY